MVELNALRQVCISLTHFPPSNVNTQSSNSIPLLRRPRNRLPLRHPPPTCRPPQNARPTIPLHIPPHNPQLHTRRSQLPKATLARHSPLRNTHRHRLSPLLLHSQRFAPICREIESPHVHRADRSKEGKCAILVFESAAVKQYGEFDYRGYCAGVGGVCNDADYGY